jgi:hypothetical protein
VAEPWWVFVEALVDQAGDHPTELVVREPVGDEIPGTAGQAAIADLIVFDFGHTKKGYRPSIPFASIDQSPPIRMAWHEVEEGGIRRVLGEHLFCLGKGCGSFDLNARRSNLCHSPREKFRSVNYKKSEHGFLPFQISARTVPK